MSSGPFTGRRVLVTGSDGFLGRVLCRALLDAGARVQQYDVASGGDVLDMDAVRWTCETIQPEYVFHLAGQSIVEKAQASPWQTFEVNVRGTWNVLEVLREIPSVRGIVVSSSNHIYGRQEVVPTPEDSPLRHLSAYSASKTCADYVARCYGAFYGVPVVALRHTNTYGPHDPHRSHLIPGTILSILEGRAPVLRSDGMVRKGYLYEDDTIAAYLTAALAAHDHAGQAFNAAPVLSYGALAVTNTIIGIMGSDLEPVVLGQPTTEEHEYLDSAALRALGWIPQIGLERGLRMTAEAMRTAFAGVP